MATPNLFRKPYGPGWTLVGDAGYTKDPITAQGIKDAFRDAEAATDALDAVLIGGQPFEDVMGRYQQARDEAALPMFEFTCGIATPGASPDEQIALLAATAADSAASTDFTRMWAGVLPVPEFFAPDNIGRILARSAASTPGNATSSG
jgi:2-polyprenyl-6-methoxyphenol hydroxylase-like FAD-dependent oxidoreductase